MKRVPKLKGHCTMYFSFYILLILLLLLFVRSSYNEAVKTDRVLDCTDRLIH